MDICIRPSTPVELERLLAIQTNAIQIYCNGDYSPQQLAALVEDQHQVRLGMVETRLAAEVAGRLVGFATIWWVSPLQGWLGAVYVQPGMGRRGIGRRLLQEIEELAIAQNTQQLQVVSSLTAVRFYQANGYRLRRRMGFWTTRASERVWIPCILLEKPLRSPTAAERRPLRKDWVPLLGLLVLIIVLIVRSRTG